MNVSPLFEYDIEEIVNYDDIDDFLSFIKANNLSIFALDEYYFTIFHVLILESRISDFNKIANYIKDDIEGYKNKIEFNDRCDADVDLQLRCQQ
jgi:hypothetical protein